MEHAELEWDKGDLLQASEKSWGAVGQYLKALATEYGLKHTDHSEFRQVAQQLARQTGKTEISDLFDTAESLHSNFYEAHMDEDTVRSRMDKMRRYVAILKEVPSPAVRPRKPFTPGRPFYRDRQPRGRPPQGRRL